MQTPVWCNLSIQPLFDLTHQWPWHQSTLLIYYVYPQCAYPDLWVMVVSRSMATLHSMYSHRRRAFRLPAVNTVPHNSLGEVKLWYTQSVAHGKILIVMHFWQLRRDFKLFRYGILKRRRLTTWSHSKLTMCPPSVADSWSVAKETAATTVYVVSCIDDEPIILAQYLTMTTQISRQRLWIPTCLSYIMRIALLDVLSRGEESKKRKVTDSP